MKKKQKMIIILVVVAVVCCVLSAVIAMTTKTSDPVSDGGYSDPVSDGGYSAAPSTDSMGNGEDCTVAETDWINSKMTENDWSQAQGEAAQKCKVPSNLQARIT